MAFAGRRAARAGHLWRAAAALALLAVVGAGPGETQPLPASLVADNLRYDEATETLVAEGNVEVFYQGRVLRARRIVYDAAAEEIRATGPIEITDPDGSVVLADAASLTPDLEEGLIAGARVLVGGELQVAATEARRIGGRYATLHQTVASSCEICAGDPRPTWAIRAARVTRDAETRQIHFRDATLEVFGLPVAWFPYLRIPDPSLARASGFLVPEFRNSGIYGFGVKTPYYRVLGPSADATVTPFVTTTGAFLLEGEYRQEYSFGGMVLDGVLALSDGMDDGFGRGAISALGAFDLGREFVAEFDFNVASDDDFLQQFDYSDADRLTSRARIIRVRDRELVDLGTIAFQSLREGEPTGNIPFVFPQFSYRRLFGDPVGGGRVGVDANALGLIRDLGRDEVRTGAGLDWYRQEILPRGVVGSALALVDAEFYRVEDDPGFSSDVEVSITGTVGAELRWPLARRGGRRTHVLEPIVQLLYTGNDGQESVPNEDSQLPEFDTTNLFALNRYPGVDRWETGLRANVGARYMIQDPVGDWRLNFTGGRVLRASGTDDFPAGTGLDGHVSDIVTAVSFTLGDRLGLANRALFTDQMDFLRNEVELALANEDGAVSVSYIFFAEDNTDPFLAPEPESSELAFEGRYRFHPNWEIRGDWRYDFASGSNIRAGGGVIYGNECAEFDLSVSRRFTSSDNVPPSTSVGFTVRLAGLGSTGTHDWPAQGCRG